MSPNHQHRRIRLCPAPRKVDLDGHHGIYSLWDAKTKLLTNYYPHLFISRIHLRTTNFHDAQPCGYHFLAGAIDNGSQRLGTNSQASFNFIRRK